MALKVHIINYGTNMSANNRANATKLGNALQKYATALLDPGLQFLTKADFANAKAQDNTWFSITMVTDRGDGTPERQFNTHVLVKFIVDPADLNSGTPTA